MAFEQGNLDFNRSMRAVAVVPETQGMPEHQVIFYGLTGRDIDGMRPVTFHVTDTFRELSRGGRRSGNPIEDEFRLRKHYFNKRILTDEERIGGQSLRSSGDRDGVEAQDSGGSVRGAGQVAFPTTVAGSGAGDANGDQDSSKEESNSN